MPFTIPNEASAPADAAQSTLYQSDIDILVAGIDGDGVLVGCTVSAQGTPNNTVAVAAGEVRIGGVNVPVTAANVTMPAADATNPRWVLVSVNSSGTLAATAGTAAASPLLPAVPASSVALAAVWWPANDTTVASSQITDKRVVILGAPSDGRAVGASVTYIGVPGVDLSGSSSTRSLVNNRVYYAPMLVTAAITVDQLLCEVSTAAGAGATARMGIYRADASWQPTSLVVDGGTVATDSTGVKTASISVTLQPGRYLTALNASAVCTMRTYRGGARYVGLSPSLGSAAYVAIAYAAQTYGAYPSTGAVWDTVATQAAAFDHMVFCRLSAAT